MECEEVSCTHHYQSAWNNPGEYCKKIGWVRNTMLKTDNHPTAIIIKSNFAYWSQRQPIEKILGRYLQWKSLGRNWYENSKRTKKMWLGIYPRYRAESIHQNRQRQVRGWWKSDNNKSLLSGETKRSETVATVKIKFKKLKENVIWNRKTRKRVM